MGLYASTVDLTCNDENAERVWRHVTRELVRFGKVELVKSNPVVLYIGCGRGLLLSLLHERGIEGIGVDRNLQPKREGCDIRLADATNLPVEDGTISLAFSCGMYDPGIYGFNIAVLEDIFAEVRRVLKDGGLYLIMDADQPQLDVARKVGLEVIKDDDYLSVLGKPTV